MCTYVHPHTYSGASDKGHFSAKDTFLGPKCTCIPYISELKQGTNRSLVSFTSLDISSDNVNRGLVLLLLLCLIYKPGHN